jgi:hypothetical protein
VIVISLYDENVGLPIITYRSLWEKYPEMKYDLLKLREQKMFAFKMSIMITLLIGFGIGLLIGVNYG